MGLAVLEVLVVLRVLAVLRVCLAGALRLTFDTLTELVTAMSSARPRPDSHSGMVTSPGRRPLASPKIPFSGTGDRRPSSEISLTKLRMALWRTMRCLQPLSSKWRGRHKHRWSAQRAGNLPGQNGNPQSVSHRGTKRLRSEDRVEPVRVERASP